MTDKKPNYQMTENGVYTISKATQQPKSPTTPDNLLKFAEEICKVEVKARASSKIESKPRPSSLAALVHGKKPKLKGLFEDKEQKSVASIKKFPASENG